MKDAIESLPAARPLEQEGFANRKLIRPSLNRAEHNHTQLSISDRRDRPEQRYGFLAVFARQRHHLDERRKRQRQLGPAAAFQRQAAFRS